MKIIYALRGNNYNDLIDYEFDKENEIITAHYFHNIRSKDGFLSEGLLKLWEIIENVDKDDYKVTTDKYDLSSIEEGDRFERIPSDLPVNPIVDVERKNGELYIKLAHMPLRIQERNVIFNGEGKSNYLVNVNEYEVVE